MRSSTPRRERAFTAKGWRTISTFSSDIAVGIPPS
jgi:hypothetical protein